MRIVTNFIINSAGKGRKMRKITIIGILFAFISSFAFSAEVNVFSARHYDSDIQLYEKFTAKTGIKVKIQH